MSVLEDYLRKFLDAEPWRKRAACRDMGPQLFFPRRGVPTVFAKEICATCPVKAECDAHADSFEEEYGVWGGRIRQPPGVGNNRKIKPEVEAVCA